MDERIRELQFLLRHGWGPDELARLTKAVVMAMKLKAPGENYIASLNALRDHLEICSKHFAQSLDAFVQEVPCTRYSRIRYMEVLTGEPLAWGTPFDLNERAQELCEHIRPDAGHSHERYRANIRQQERAGNARDSAALNKAQKERQAMEDLDHSRMKAVSKPLLTELLRILQHMEDARAHWEKAPVRSGNFQDYLGHERFAKVETAMLDLGIAPKALKGKNEVVAAFHAACERFSLRLPDPGQWPGMLSATFPGSSWSEKSKPETRPAFQAPGYKRAFRAMHDRLE